MSQQVALKIYRSLFRQLRLLDRVGSKLKVRLPITSDWGEFAFEAGEKGDVAAVLSKLLPRLSMAPSSLELSRQELEGLVRGNFRAHQHAPANSQPHLLGDAFAALRVISEQLVMQACSSSMTSDGVQVDVVSTYKGLVIQGPGADTGHMFSYRVSIANLREDPICVMGREWSIRDAEGSEVGRVPLASNGVVGAKPIILPGRTFQYVSGVYLNSPGGSMEGRLKVHVFGNGRNPQFDLPTEEVLPAVGIFRFQTPEAAATALQKR